MNSDKFFAPIMCAVMLLIGCMGVVAGLGLPLIVGYCAFLGIFGAIGLCKL